MNHYIYISKNVNEIEIDFKDKFGETIFSITRQELFSLLKNNVSNSDIKTTAYL